MATRRTRRSDAASALLFPLLERLTEGGPIPMSENIAEAATLALQHGLVRFDGPRARLALTKRGEQWLRANDPRTATGVTRQAITREANQAAAELAREAGLTIQETLSAIVLAVHAERDRLTRHALAQGVQYPWEAIRLLARLLDLLEGDQPVE